MTLNEVREKIVTSNSPDWFNTAELEVKISYLNLDYKIVGISSVVDFLIKQINGWEKEGDNIPDEFAKVKRQFKDFLSNVLHLFTLRDEWERKSFWAQSRSTLR